MRLSVAERFWSKVNKGEDHVCWEWTAALNNSYGWFSINKKARHSHRVAAFLAGLIPSVDGGLHVLHRCDNPKCCNPNHLFVGTNADNVADRVAKGRSGRSYLWGEKNGASKLTNEQIKQVRLLCFQDKMSQTQVAKMFNIRQPHVSRIVNNVRCGGVL